MQVLQEQRGVSFEFKGALDINTIDGTRRALLEYLGQHASIVVDLSLVESCDAAGAQLLIALEKSAESAGKPYSILAVSAPCIQDCADIGIRIHPSKTPSSAQSEDKEQETKRPRNHAKAKSDKNVVEGADA